MEVWPIIFNQQDCFYYQGRKSYMNQLFLLNYQIVVAIWFRLDYNNGYVGHSVALDPLSHQN
jgi:hypothetical protein